MKTKITKADYKKILKDIESLETDTIIVLADQKVREL